MIKHNKWYLISLASPPWKGPRQSSVSRYRMNAIVRTIMLLALFVAVHHTAAQVRRFTIDDDIGIAHFGDPNREKVEPLLYSPDGNYIAVVTERGRLDINRTESTVWIYRSDQIQRALSSKDNTPPAPYWTFVKSEYGQGSNITHLQWLPNSSGLAFLAKTVVGSDRLLLADLKRRNVTALTPEDQQIQGFDVRDRNHAVYAVLNPAIIHQREKQDNAGSIVATGHVYDSLLLPPTGYSFLLSSGLFDQSELWAIVDGKRFRVQDRTSGKPLHMYTDGAEALALAPDGHSAVTATPVGNVPNQWAGHIFAWPSAISGKEIISGPQDLTSFGGFYYIAQYSVIDLLNGKAVPLIDAPTAFATYWPVQAHAHYSSDGHFVLLSDTYLSPTNQLSVKPCVAVVDLSNRQSNCVTYLKEQGERGQTYYLFDADFMDDHATQVRLEYLSSRNESRRDYATFHKEANHTWQQDSMQPGVTSTLGFDLAIRQNVNTPPALIASDRATNVSKLILDPNPQLKTVALAPVSILKWKDDSGREWRGGLYSPPNWNRDRRLPLLIQTHDFSENEFNPAGISPSGFAAQELAATGILVVQVEETPLEFTTQEGPSSVAEVDSLVDKLVLDGLVDPDRVGIVGWSRTCYHVMETLTTGKTKIRAALISDGVNFGYLQFLLGLDYFGQTDGGEVVGVIGALPFGPGLKTWMERSPEFNLDRVRTPLQAVAYGRRAVLEMWEPYAGLRYLHKPVELIVLNTDEHTITNPVSRVAAQGGSIDWFRFWLQDYEDPDPAKADQYKRWRELRKQEQAQMSIPQTANVELRK